MRHRTLLSTFVLGALAAACSSGGDSTGTTTTTTQSTTTSGGGGGAGGAGGHQGGSGPSCDSLGEGGASCSLSSYPPGTEETAVDIVTADIMDLDGQPAAGIPAEVCGYNMCYTGVANASGHMSVNAAGSSLTVALMLYGDGIDWVRLFAPLPNPGDTAFGTITAARLPTEAQGAPLVLGQDAVSGDVTLHLDAAAFVEFDILTYGCEVALPTFRTVTIPVDGSATLPAVTPALSLGMLFGMAPINTLICPAAKMTVPNLPGWAANAEVEFLLEGTSIFQEWAMLRDWTKVSDGAVSADGTTVSTADGQGIPMIGTIGVRLKAPGG